MRVRRFVGLQRVPSQLGLALFVFICPCVLLGACDFFYLARASVPLVAPVDTACLHSAIGRGPQHWRKESLENEAERRQVTGVVFSTPSMFSNNWQVVAQSAPHDSTLYLGKVYRDSGASLAASVVQVNRRFDRANAPLVSAELTDLLLYVRDACGGRSPDDERLFSVEINETPYRMWVVRGTQGRVAMRLTVEGRRYRLQTATSDEGRFVLRADTLASVDGRGKWLEVDSLPLPTPGNHATLATACWRGDSESSGDLVVLARDADTQYFVEILNAWALDRTTLRLHAVPVEGIECRNTDYYSILPDGARELRLAALRFRPAPGHSRIYAYLSTPGFATDRLLPKVTVDEQVVGRLQGGSFLMVEMEPGRHRVAAVTGVENAMWIDAAADSSSFVELRGKRLVLRSQAGVSMMDADRARRVIRTAHMVPSSWPGTATAHK